MLKLKIWQDYSLHYSRLIRQYVFRRSRPLRRHTQVFEILHLLKVLELQIWQDYSLHGSKSIQRKNFP